MADGFATAKTQNVT